MSRKTGTFKEFQNHTLAIARGERRVEPGETKLWREGQSEPLNDAITGDTEDFGARLRALELRIEPLARLVHAFAASLPKPLLYHSGKEHYGVRYGKPGVEHFCLLKAARIVSALNAMLALARRGYAQEIGVLIRTLVEFASHIEFVLEGRNDDGSLGPQAAKYVQDYFTDYRRGSPTEYRKAQVPQRAVNKRLGASLDEIARQYGTDDQRIPAEERYSHIYLTFSNYVHGKYPEIMDMYGGTPGHFHLCGMRGTPKDHENIQMIDAFLDTASITFRLMVIQLRLHSLLDTDEVLAGWYRG